MMDDFASAEIQPDETTIFVRSPGPGVLPKIPLLGVLQDDIGGGPL